MPVRSKILWLGHRVPAALATVVPSFGLAVHEIREDELDEIAPQACAIVTPFYSIPQFIGAVRRTKITAWNHGLLIIGCCEESRLTSSLAHAYTLSKLEADSTHPGRPSRLLFDNWIGVCVAAVKHIPGQPFGAIAIEAYDEQEKAYLLAENHSLLFSRAFWGFERVTVRSLPGGHSGAQAFTVHAFKTLDGYQRPIPFLAKISETEEIEEERELYHIHVQNHIPFNNRPNIIDARCCVGPHQSILVEDFLDRAERLDRVIRTGSPTVLIASIFDGALRGWRLTPARKTSSLANFFLARRVVRNDEFFRDACAHANLVENIAIDADKIISTYERLPELEANWVTSHGDLHARNIFINSGSAEALIIDYADVAEGPAVGDPACLEVDLVFFGGGINIPHEFREEIYSYPLQIPSLRFREGPRAWLWDAVRALRVFGGAADRQTMAYAIALVSYLLRISRIKAVDIRVRARAAVFANTLLCQMVTP